MNEIQLAELIIRLSVALVMIGFGLNQLLDPEAWEEYIPPWLAKLLPVSQDVFMRLHGSGNVTLGLLLAIGLWEDVISWVVLLWWVTLLPFVYYVGWRLGLRDTAIIGALIALVILTGNA